MIFKSFIVEKDISKLEKFLAILFYGENLGLKDDFKELIKERFNEAEQISFQQNDLIKNPDLLNEQILNTSLIVYDFSDKLKKIVNDAIESADDNAKIVLFAENLDKKSSIRAAFEKEQNLAIIPCYKDNEKTLSIYIREKLRNYYSKSQFHFQLSMYEGFGLALCEAMLCRCIPIGSSVNMKSNPPLLISSRFSLSI